MAGFQVKVVLEGVQPPLWRRILLPDQLSFADLHDILQVVFGWQEEHLHQFYSTKKLITDGISYLMQSYGFMELSALHEKYQKAFGPIAYEELMRYLYLDGRFYGKYETGECLIDNAAVSYASFGGLDAELVLQRMKAYGQGRNLLLLR